MFKCTCGYPTCKEEYTTEEARERHLRGVLAAETKKELAKSDGDKPITSKTKSGKGHENWSEVAKRAARTRKRNNISKKLFGKKYKELSLADKQKVDTGFQDQITPEPITKDEESARKIAPKKAFMSAKREKLDTNGFMNKIEDASLGCMVLSIISTIARPIVRRVKSLRIFVNADTSVKSLIICKSLASL